MIADGENESQGDDSTNQITRNHDPSAVKPVEKYAGKRTGGNGRNRTGKHDTGDDGAAVRIGYGQAENCNVIEMVSDFTDNLPHPSEPVIAVSFEKLSEIRHGSGVEARLQPTQNEPERTFADPTNTQEVLLNLDRRDLRDVTVGRARASFPLLSQMN